MLLFLTLCCTMFTKSTFKSINFLPFNLLKHFQNVKCICSSLTHSKGITVELHVYSVGISILTLHRIHPRLDIWVGMSEENQHARELGIIVIG